MSQSGSYKPSEPEMNDEKKLAEVQPQNGDTFLSCGHTSEGTKLHFWMYTTPVKFLRPDHTRGSAKWLIACDDCRNKADNNTDRIVIIGDGIWKGDDPVVYTDC